MSQITDQVTQCWKRRWLFYYASLKRVSFQFEKKKKKAEENLEDDDEIDTQEIVEETIFFLAFCAQNCSNFFCTQLFLTPKKNLLSVKSATWRSKRVSFCFFFEKKKKKIPQDENEPYEIPQDENGAQKIVCFFLTVQESRSSQVNNK